MYLKSIEIQGFKSFANRIVLDFHNGITGIVGPNGSGKSNVADAVRWVLGEQRIKQLRGASMQDVIFAGTELRRPQGLAYVAITLSNVDHQLAIEYDEVTVSRRLYRSGESEYMLNGSACRLKDINELFYDTGIGKEGYSIIGQGQIDKILSGKPEERRELFDEAAGIVKFKRRKAIAQKKLEDEQQNLVRVGDILSELEKQVGPLKRQSEAAKSYLALKEELKAYDANLFLMESEQIQGQLGEIKEKSDIVSEDMAEANAQAQQQKEAYGRLEQQIAALEEEANGKREALTQAEMDGGSLQGQINVLKEQIHTEELRAKYVGERTRLIAAEVEERRAQAAMYQADNAGVSDAADESRRKKVAAEYALAQEDAHIRQLDQRLEEVKAGIISGLNEKAVLSAKGQRYETMLEQVQVRRSEVQRRLLKYMSDESSQEEGLKAEAGRLAETERQLEKLEKARSECESEVGKLEQEARGLAESYQECQKQYHMASTKLESLRNLAERYEGYGGSTRRVMELRSQIRGIHGVVADLVAADKKYETAIETALGGSIQNVVTDNEQTAKRLIEYLKKNKYGRQTFLPLTSIGQGSGFTRPEALREEGVIGLGSDLVHVAPQYQVLARYLLGRVIVADTIDHAIALARKYKYSLRIVTLEGELLSAGGSMAGGAFKNTSNLLGRRRELEELGVLCRKVQEDAGRLRNEMQRHEEQLQKKRGELELLRGEIHEVSLQQNTRKLGVEQLEARRDEIRESYRDLKLENSQLEGQVREIEQSRGRIQEETRTLEEANLRANQMVGELTAALEEARLARGESAKRLEAVNLEAAGLKQKVDFAMENIHRVEEEIRRLEEERQTLADGAGDSEGAIREKLDEITRLEGLIIGNQNQKAALSALLSELLEKKDRAAKEQKDVFERREELSGRVSRLDRDLYRLQGQKEKLEEKLEGQVNYMWNEYGLTFTTAALLRSPKQGSVGEVRKRIGELKDAIRSLGNVNVNAIEDYKEVSGRYEFMKAQHSDLVEAEAELVKIIGELDEGMRRQFGQKFQEIRREFDRVFKELFGGGHGELELMEEADILEAGVQIIAQPPGKKLQNMMQLSGGEKALTAISLLFAIQNLKPSPFCLLDEIEAALDDSNVDRFAGYLHKLTKNTQFIVITHRRGTMVAADRLYGITMQEKGVSALVSVNLIADQLEQ